MHTPPRGMIFYRRMIDPVPRELRDDSLEYWFRASRLTGYTGGDAVNPLEDLSGDNDATQAAVSSQALYRGDHVETDGDDWYETASMTDELSAATWVMVARRVSGTDNVFPMAHTDSLDDSIEMRLSGSDGLTWVIKEGGTTETTTISPVDVTTTFVAVGRYSQAAGEAKVWFNDTATNSDPTTFTNPIVSARRSFFGRNFGSGWRDFLTGDFFEGAMYVAALSDSRIESDIIPHLLSHYGI